jgi:hypothetical protein
MPQNFARGFDRHVDHLDQTYVVSVIYNRAEALGLENEWQALYKRALEPSVSQSFGFVTAAMAGRKR